MHSQREDKKASVNCLVNAICAWMYGLIIDFGNPGGLNADTWGHILEMMFCGKHKSVLSGVIFYFYFFFLFFGIIYKINNYFLPYVRKFGSYLKLSIS